MLPANTRRFLIFFVCGALLFFCGSTAARAHIDEGNMPDSVAEMEYRILLEFKPNNLEVRNRLGMVLFRTKRLHEAAQEFRYVLERETANLDAAGALALVSLAQERFREAVDLLRKVVAGKPADILSYYHLGRGLEQLGREEEAAETYRAGLALKTPDFHGRLPAATRLLLQNALEKINAGPPHKEGENS
jgi:Flp pilus assembly protein TadD